MSWISLAIVYLIASALAKVAQKVVSKRSSAGALTLSMVYAGGSKIGLIIYALSIGTVDFNIARENWQLVALNMMIFPTAHIFVFRGLRHLDVGLHAIVFSSRVFYTVLGAIILLDESITLTQLLGLSLILLSVAAIHSRGRENKNTKKGLAYTSIAALLYGIGGVVDKLYLDKADLTNFFVFGSGGTTLALILMYAIHQKINNKPLMPRKNSVYWKFVAIGIGFKALSDIAYFSALQKLDNVAHLSAVGTFSIILTILLGIVLLKERSHVKLKIAVGIMATIGFLLLI